VNSSHGQLIRAPPKTSPERAKHENRTGCSVENESGRAKILKHDMTHSVTPKTSPGAQNIKIGPDALGTVKNESGRAKHENGS
jgi:hypothetical protein